MHDKKPMIFYKSLQAKSKVYGDARHIPRRTFPSSPNVNGIFPLTKDECSFLDKEIRKSLFSMMQLFGDLEKAPTFECSQHQKYHAFGVNHAKKKLQYYMINS